MTPLEATELVLAAVKSALDSLPVAYTFDGERYEPPVDASWVRVSVRDLPPEPSSHGPVGQRVERQRADVIAQCFAPLIPDDGQAGAMALAQQVRVVFRGLDLGTAGDTVTFLGADLRRIGVDGDAGPSAFYQVNVSARFAFHETF